MLLIGMFDSPFVRRVAVTLKLLGIPFEHRPYSVGKDFDRIRAFNPLGRVPTLVLDAVGGGPIEGGEVLIDSAAILDHLDELAGERALLPRSGSDRRRSLRLMATATGAADKGVAQLYERAFRPEEKRHQPWVDRCKAQVDTALTELNRACGSLDEGGSLVGATFGQADLTVACVFTFLDDAGLLEPDAHRALRRFTTRIEAMPEMIETRLRFVPPAA
jgi:glutathione S-transferase